MGKSKSGWSGWKKISKKMKTPELEKEFELLKRAKVQVESDKPLREMAMTPEDKKRIKGFMFLSEKPIFYVLNIGESTELGKELEEAVSKYKLTEIAARPNAAATAICGKVEAELAEMSDADAAEFLSSYGLTESGLVRLIRTTYKLLGLISFFTAGEDECRAWQVPANSRAQDAAGAIHSDLEKHFIRAETIRWDQLWKQDQKLTPAPKARCDSKAKITSCRMATSCTSGTRGDST